MCSPRSTGKLSFWISWMRPGLPTSSRMMVCACCHFVGVYRFASRHCARLRCGFPPRAWRSDEVHRIAAEIDVPQLAGHDENDDLNGELTFPTLLADFAPDEGILRKGTWHLPIMHAHLFAFPHANLNGQASLMFFILSPFSEQNQPSATTTSGLRWVSQNSSRRPEQLRPG